LTEKVAKGQYTFLSPWWDEISASAKDLVSKLLTVDPNSRYTIDQFLQHPWITQSAGPTTSTTPSPVPSGVSNTTPTRIGVPVVKGDAIHIENKDHVVPPVSVTLKEVFDVSNAVYRMEEENSRARRKQPIRQQVLAEEDEEEHDDDPHNENLATVEEQLERVSVGNVPRSSRRVGTPANMSSGFAPSGIIGNGGLFELHLEGATLLERRKRTPSKPIAAPLVT